MSISLVLGGASSGKSFFAEQLLAEQKNLIYIATAESKDSEMANKIKLHKERRGAMWQTVESPLALLDVLKSQASSESAILVDCLTMWLSNIMLAGMDVESEISKLVSGIEKLAGCNIVFVSNEVGHGIVPMNSQARQFRQFSGKLNQEVAKVASSVYFVVAGIGQKIKKNPSEKKKEESV